MHGQLNVKMYRNTKHYTALHLETFLQQRLLAHSTPSYTAWNWHYVLKMSPATCSPVYMTVFQLARYFFKSRPFFTCAERTYISRLPPAQLCPSIPLHNISLKLF